MTRTISEDQVQAALDNCAAEPVHIPGFIQPFGWLFAYELRSGIVSYASDNLVEVLERPLVQIFGTHVRDLIGRELWHGLQNQMAISDAATKRHIVGSWQHSPDKSFIVSAWLSGSFVVIELEMQTSAPLLSTEQFQNQTRLIDQVQSSQSIETLLDVSTRQLQHLTGFDRVMVYRFDQDWNGEVIAESHSSAVEPFLGLNFPSFDIPAQAREIMARLPLRIIADVDQPGVPISAASDGMAPLDISFGELRGTSKVHIQYLKNMGTQATMTLSVVIDGALWGIISFHNRRPRVVPTQIRMILKGFLDVFCLKLGLLHEKKLNELSEGLDALQQDFQSLISSEPDIQQLVAGLGTKICETLDACGVCVRSEDGDYTYGVVPDRSVSDALIATLQDADTTPYFTDSLRVSLPGMGNALGAVAGAAVVRHINNWVLLIFREERAEDIAWAGDPEKTIEFVDGDARLTPRGSFSTFLATTKGKSKVWSSDDRALSKKLWPLLSTVLNSEQRRHYLRDLNRQQELMIDELNHRVRNILALVQSVSTEAKKSESSLESYSTAIEARIRALAAAHSIGAGSSAKNVHIADIILQEARPYDPDGNVRVRVSGDKGMIVADLAPIFALTIHELMTNAAKYGALSNSTGLVEVTLRHIDDDFEIRWTEKGGPPVSQPVRQGFGTTLVKRAVPYELKGKSSIEFNSEGVRARILLPGDILGDSASENDVSYQNPRFADKELTGPVIPDTLKSGIAMIVEDNFMIAEGVAHQLQSIGFENVETASSVESAMEFLEDQTPSFAVLDVNLGQGHTSLPIAEVLLDRQVPLVFATGYGELSNMPARLSKSIVLTKPLDVIELAHAINRSID